MNLSELKNIDLKNLDIKDLLEKVKNSELLKDKKFLTKFGIYFGSILLFMVIYYAFINPKVEAQKQRIRTINQLENILNSAVKTKENTILIAIYNNQNQRRYIGVKLK